MAIRSFGNRETECFFVAGTVSKKCKWSSLKKIARRKLDMLDYARSLKDLKSPPSNHLEALKGQLKGFFSIRINDQWRIIFRWDVEPYDAEIIDYH